MQRKKFGEALKIFRDIMKEGKIIGTRASEPWQRQQQHLVKCPFPPQHTASLISTPIKTVYISEEAVH